MTEVSKFLGASISSFNSSVGWGGEESKLDVTLVEDTNNGDSFIEPITGSPQIFECGNFRFGGIVQNISKSGNSSGSPIYSVTLVDPRVLLNGVQVILGDYSGITAGIPNIVNVFGYYESARFGGSGSNGTGMSWSYIRSAIVELISDGLSSNFGGPISYKGYSYGLNINSLPDLTSLYRIGGSMSLMDLIQQVCDAGGCDFFVTLTSDGTIVINTISRLSIPDLGIISRFITQTDGAVSKNIGQNMVNETCGKMLVGGKVRDIYINNYSGGDDRDETTGIDNNIWWCWGKNANGSVVIGDGLGDSHTFVLDSSSVLIPGVGNTYPTSIGEMRAALVDEATWASYLWFNNYSKYLIDPNGRFTDTITSGVLYRHNKVRNPHLGKARAININNSYISRHIIDFLTTNNLNRLNTRDLIELLPGYSPDSTKLYNLVRNYAEEYYGKKILVRIPNVQVAYDTSLNKLVYNMYPVDGGYIDSALLALGVQNNIIPPDINRITNQEDNTFKCYVRFDNIGILDFSDISEDELIFSADGRSIFIECDIDNEIYFANTLSFSYPRVILTLPGRVTFFNNSVIDTGILEELIKSISDVNGISSDKSKNRLLSAINSRVGNSQLVAALPAMAAVPLESQMNRYGPWYASGSNGAMEYETDDTLVPWEYGGFSGMNSAGLAKVTANIANLQNIESGSIEFPGLPTLSIGEQLLSTGPYVSNIQMNVGPNGVTTSYRMESWRPMFGKLNDFYASTLNKMGKLYNQNVRNARFLLSRKRKR